MRDNGENDQGGSVVFFPQPTTPEEGVSTYILGCLAVLRRAFPAPADLTGIASNEPAREFGINFLRLLQDSASCGKCKMNGF